MNRSFLKVNMLISAGEPKIEKKSETKNIPISHKRHRLGLIIIFIFGPGTWTEEAYPMKRKFSTWNRNDPWAKKVPTQDDHQEKIAVYWIDGDWL